MAGAQRIVDGSGAVPQCQSERSLVDGDQPVLADAPMARLKPAKLGAALFLGSAVAVAAYRRGSLTKSGAGAATLIGAATFLAGGPRWSGLLLSFFGSSSLLSRLETRSPSGGKIAAMNERGSRRDAVQAAANGGVAAAAAAAHLAWPAAPAAAAFAGAIAAANADTWATEIGGLSRLPPRDIVSGYAVAAGSSGGVTPAGLAGALAGSALVGALSGLLQRSSSPARRALVVLLSGLTGSLVDSVAGSLLQGSYVCPSCKKITERRVHSCGRTTQLVKGRAWCTNDLVNLMGTLSGALLSAILTAISGDD